MAKITRRDAMTFVFGTFAGAALLRGGGWVEGELWNVYENYSDPLNTTLNRLNPLDAERLRLIDKLFGDRGRKLKFVGGMAHHLYPKDMHPDDRWACNEITRVAGMLAQEQVTVENPLDNSAEGSFVCTGSPVSNDRSRAFMEYEYVNPENPSTGLQRVDNPVLKLPIKYILDSERLGTISAGNHSSEDGKTVPNWSVLIHDSPCVPDDKTDYLLISRLPNFLERERERFSDFRNSVTIFGGCHGYGTSAVRLLFQDLVLLKRLERIAQQFEYWQAMVEVTFATIKKHPVAGIDRPVAVALADKLIAAEPVTVAPDTFFSGG